MHFVGGCAIFWEIFVKGVRMRPEVTCAQVLERIARRRMIDQMNPPVLMRERCRFCGEAMEGMQEMAVRATGQVETPGEIFAHQACVARERPR